MTTKHKRSAFSLIELFVVVTIIAILSSSVVVVIGQARTSARHLVCSNNLRLIELYAHLYASDRNGVVMPAHRRWWLPWNGYANYDEGQSVHADVWRRSVEFLGVLCRSPSV